MSSRLRKDTNLPEIRFSTLHDFFRAAESSPAFASLPVVRGELQHHARGCYSANGEGKFLNRRAERSWRGRNHLPHGQSQRGHVPTRQNNSPRAWWKVLFCQFHDMMAGTSLYSDYQDVRDSVGYACEVAQTAKVEALETMAKRVDLSNVEEGAVFLFNPLPWKRKALVEFYTGSNPSGESRITHLASKDGIKTPGAVATLGQHDHLRSRGYLRGSTFLLAVIRSSSWLMERSPPRRLQQLRLPFRKPASASLH